MFKNVPRINNYRDFLAIAGCFLPLTLIFSILITEIIVIILSIFSIIYIIKKKILIQNCKLLLSIFFFWIILIISSIYSDHKIIPILKSISYIRFLLFALGLYLLFQYKKEYLRIFLYVIFFSILILFFDTLIQLFFKKNILGYKLIQPERPSSFFGEELKLGSYVVRFLPIFFSLYFLNLIKNKSIFFIIFFLSIILIILSGERSAVFMLLLFILGILFFLKNFLKWKIILFLGFFFILLLSLNFIPSVKKRIIFDTIKDFKNDDKIFIFSKVHTSHLNSAFKIFLDNIYLGTGMRTFRYECSKEKYNIILNKKGGKVFLDSCSTHPHNTYFELLSETGIFSFTFILLFYISCIIYLIRKKFFLKIRYNYDYYNFEVIIVLSVLVNLFPFMPSGSFFNNWLSIFYFLPLSLWFFIKKNINN